MIRDTNVKFDAHPGHRPVIIYYSRFILYLSLFKCPDFEFFIARPQHGRTAGGCAAGGEAGMRSLRPLRASGGALRRRGQLFEHRGEQGSVCVGGRGGGEEE